MKQRLLAFFLLAASAHDAGAQRVLLNVPLSPSPAFSAPAVDSRLNAPMPQALAFGLANWASPLTPVMSQPVPLGAVPVNLAPAVAGPLPALPRAVIPAASASSKPAGAKAPKVIDSLRAHGAESGNLSGLIGEAGAGALEKNFMSAASLDGGGAAPPASDAASNLAPQDGRPLAERMLERVRLDDRGRPDEKKALENAFARLLETPTGRRYAKEFLAEGLTAHVHFEDFPDSRLFLVDGRKKFYAAQALTDWRSEGYAEVRLNRHYVDGDPEYMRESLPSIIGHELLGHGLWYGRAAKENLYIAFHYHELNETLARLVGWAIDHELDGRFEETGAWSYLSDPAHYLSHLRMRHPYYATTFGQSEMAKPVETLRSRQAAAQLEVERARRNLAAQKTWLPVLDHFANGHDIHPTRFDLLRKELADLESRQADEIVNAESVLRQVSGLLERIEVEPDHSSELYLSQAAAHPFFERLSADTLRLGAALHRMANAAPEAPPRAAVPRPADQITWEELAKLYQDDVAADAHRAIKHWNH